MSEFKKGDKVWVLCKVIEPCESLIKVTPSGDENWFWAGRGQCRPVEPSNSPKIPDGSSEAMRAAFEGSMAKRYDWYQGYFSRNDNRYFDSSVEMAWQAFQAGAKYQSSPLAPSPCMEGVDVDQFIEGVMEVRGRTDGFQVGDAVRFVLPGHDRHGTEGVILSIVKGPNREYNFRSNCGQFHRYCTIAELERVDQANPIDIKGSMQSLDGADTIQAGDLQWTDRDGKYRLCNFTIGMRVYQAIERGKAHGEKWVFYRKFKEVAEASGANDGPKRKQYRTPTLADLANGPIACECIGTQLDKWQPQILLEILSEAGYPYRASCPKNQHKITRWSQCRIEAGE